MKSLLIAAFMLTAAPVLADQPHTYGHPFRIFGSHAHAAAAKTAVKAAATTAPTIVTNPLTAVQTFTVSDLQNALALANAQTNLPVGVTQPAPYNTTVTGGDTRHGNCWAALIQFAQGIQANNVLPNQLGLATLQQTIFDDQQLVGRPLLPDYVVTNCALTLNDANMNFLQLTTALGVKAITIPKLPF